jgi:hypothetical protein
VDGGGHPVAAPDGEEGEGGRRRQRQVPLLAGDGAEVEAGAGVDDQPRLEFPVGDGGPHVGDAGAGGQVPVHAPDVVTRGVDPPVGRLGAAAGDETLVVALKEPVELAGDGQLQLAEPVLPADDVGRTDHEASVARGEAQATNMPTVSGLFLGSPWERTRKPLDIRVA